MMKSIIFKSSIILALVLNACSSNMGSDDEYFGFGFDELLAEWGFTYKNICPSVTDAIEYPEYWYVAIDRYAPPDETVRLTSTCGLLATLIERPLRVMMTPSSDLYEHRITKFNNELLANNVAIEFFNRGDFFPVIASKYLSIIKISGTAIESLEDDPITLEWFLGSNMCVSAMSQKEKIQLMNMAMLRTKYAAENEIHQPCMIMIAIMKSCSYTPFMEDIEPRLVEIHPGYAMLEPDGTIPLHTFLSQDRDIIINYAKQFLDEQEL